MKTESNDTHLNTTALELQSADFDWPSLYEVLGEAQSELPERDYDALGKALHELIKWLTRGQIEEARYETVIGRRVIGLAWVMNPGFFDGNPSLTKLAKALGMKAPDLCEHTTSVTKAFGLMNKAQAHGWNRK